MKKQSFPVLTVFRGPCINFCLVRVTPRTTKGFPSPRCEDVLPCGLSPGRWPRALSPGQGACLSHSLGAAQSHSFKLAQPSQAGLPVPYRVCVPLPLVASPSRAMPQVELAQMQTRGLSLAQELQEHSSHTLWPVPCSVSSWMHLITSSPLYGEGRVFLLPRFSKESR